MKGTKDTIKFPQWVDLNPWKGLEMRRRLTICDSGAHSFTNLLFKKSKREGGRIDWSLYKSKEFWDYVDRYANFIKEHGDAFDEYVNVDAIRNPEITWEVQQYLERVHKLSPMPVVHYNTPMRWIKKYIDAGYSYIGMGGPVGKNPYTPWADRAWNLICDTPGRLPAAKIHGFAVTTYKMISRYPWYSCDSVTWKKAAYFGQAVVAFSPKDLSKTRMIFFDDQSPYLNRVKGKGRHFQHYSKSEQRKIREWLDHIQVPFGKRSKSGEVLEEGVTNSNLVRCAATIEYFEAVARSQPKWPWPFHKVIRPTLLEAMDDLEKG